MKEGKSMDNSNENLVNYSLTEKEFKHWLFGEDAAMHLKIFLESEKEQFDKDYLIKNLIEVYKKRMNQDLERFK